MEAKEIDLVLAEVNKGAVAVERETNVLWDVSDLLQAQSNREFQNLDQITDPAKGEAVTSPYPGCPNMTGKDAQSKPERIGQTSHFVLFGLPSGSK
jgi:hypothetical protein